MQKFTEIKSVVDFTKSILEYYQKTKSKKHLFFRGHSKLSYPLIPSVFRNPHYSEKEILLDFKQYAPEHNIKYDFIYECDKVLCDMQHYGLPTRLLDWTINPLIALYFACLKSTSSKLDSEAEDGCLFAFNPWEYNKKIINYEIPENHDIHVKTRALLAYGWKFDDIKNYMKDKYHKFDINENDIMRPISCVSPYTNKRKINQRGCFIIAGTSRDEFDDWEVTKMFLEYYLIKKENKNTILKELNLLYINEYSVYPDFHGMSKMIKKWGSLFNCTLPPDAEY